MKHIITSQNKSCRATLASIPPVVAVAALLVAALLAGVEAKPVGAAPGAIFTKATRVKYDVIMPNVADFGTVSGDRTKGPHGTFIKIRKGTGTPGHRHSVAYKAVILKGLVENPFAGNPATEVKMGPGSFYAVPAGAEHITRCAADSPTDCLAYMYQEAAFDFNPDVKGVDQELGKAAKVLLDKDVKYEVIMPGVAQFGSAYGDRNKGAHGTFVKVTKGKGTPVHKHTHAYHAVVLEGVVENPIPANQANPAKLGPGSYYYVPAGADHITRCAESSPTDCRSFLYQDEAFDFIPK